MHTVILIFLWLAATLYAAILFWSIISVIRHDCKVIKRDDGTPYLIRYRVFGCKWFKIRVHHILQSDYDCLHDHPWSFVSVILKGGYWEKTTKRQFDASLCKWYDNIFKKWYGPGSILYRPAKWRHSLELPRCDSGVKSCWTFVIMFRRTREWGFWTSKGFVHWSKYNSNQKCD